MITSWCKCSYTSILRYIPDSSRFYFNPPPFSMGGTQVLPRSPGLQLLEPIPQPPHPRKVSQIQTWEDVDWFETSIPITGWKGVRIYREFIIKGQYNWLVSNTFLFSPLPDLGKGFNLTSIFFKGVETTNKIIMHGICLCIYLHLWLDFFCW